MNKNLTVLAFLVAFSACLLGPASEAVCQNATPMSERERLIQQHREKMARQKQNAQARSGQEELGAVETVSLTTKDKVVLNCTYYPGTKSKETIPFILLHDWESSRKDLLPMAEYLQKTFKHAVIVPDLRGHGDSTRVEGSDKPIDMSRFKKADIAGFEKDIERCKKFLMEKNNLGELNIEMLTLVTVGRSAVSAAGWAIEDWKWQPIGGRKQGQDVKAILMISPERKLKGVTINQYLKTDLFTGKNRKPLALYIAWAENHEATAKEGAAIVKLLKKPRSKLDESMFVARKPYPPALDGTDLVKDPRHKIVYEDINKFVQYYLVNNKEKMPWQNRAKN